MCSVLTETGVHLGRLKVTFKLKEREKPSSKSPKKTTPTSTQKDNTRHLNSGLKPDHTHRVNNDNKDTVFLEKPSPSKKWEKVSVTSHAPPIAPPTTDKVLPVFGERSKLMVDRLLERAKALQESMIRETDKENNQNNVFENESDKDVQKQNVDEQTLVLIIIIIIIIIINNFLIFSFDDIDLTPPISPSSVTSFEEHQKVGLLKLTRDEIEREKEEELILLEPHLLESHDHESISHDPLPYPQDQGIKNSHHKKLMTKKDDHHNTLQSHEERSHEERSHDFTKSREEGVSPLLYHLLLEIDEGTSLFLSSQPDTLPNVYLVCKLYSMKVPLTTGVMWRTRKPQFNIKQVNNNNNNNNNNNIIIII